MRMVVKTYKYKLYNSAKRTSIVLWLFRHLLFIFMVSRARMNRIGLRQQPRLNQSAGYRWGLQGNP